MPTLLLLLCWIAVSSATAEEELCNPVLEIQNTTMTSVTVKWWCKGNATTMLKGFELYYKPTYAGEFELAKTLDAEQHEATITELHWRFDYEVFIEAVYRDTDTPDRSESITPKLVEPIRCIPLLDIQQMGVDSVTLKWMCTNNLSPVEGYKITYRRKDDRYDDWKYATVDHPQQEVILKELTCGDEYQFDLEANQDSIEFSESDTLTAIVGELR